MDPQHAYLASSCDGCRRRAFLLRVVDGAKLCVRCTEKSAEIDRRLAQVRSEDPVSCNHCGDLVDFDARVAVVLRQCGGRVFCGYCNRDDEHRENREMS